MIFGPVPTDRAEGAVLAHSMPLLEGRLRKGKVLSAADIAALTACGTTEVIVARLEDGDLGEDAAAAHLAAAVAGDGIRIGPAATGRVNLFAEGPGIVSVDVAAINAMNAINPMITLATLPPFAPVDAGTMLATIKMIAYAVPGEDLARAAKAATQALSLLPPGYASATLIETDIGQQYSDKGRTALKTRLSRFGVTLDDGLVVPHRQEAVSEALGHVTSEVIFILTASATSDLNDVGPAAVRAAGGHVTQFGMPVDPGNLLFLGELRGRPVIGLPGCARSPALNGADWVLERVICGVPVTPADFAAMGVGGLLKEIPSRPRPRNAT